MDGTTACEVLGVPPRASRDKIKKAFRRLAQSAHPDVSGSAEEFRRLKEAFDAAYAAAPSGDPLGPLLAGAGVSHSERRGDQTSSRSAAESEQVTHVATHAAENFEASVGSVVSSTSGAATKAHADGKSKPDSAASHTVVRQAPASAGAPETTDFENTGSENTGSEPEVAPFDVLNDETPFGDDFWSTSIDSFDPAESDRAPFEADRAEPDALETQLLETKLLETRLFVDGMLASAAEASVSDHRSGADEKSCERRGSAGKPSSREENKSRSTPTSSSTADDITSDPRAPWLTNVVEDYPETAAYEAIISAAVPRSSASRPVPADVSIGTADRSASVPTRSAQIPKRHPGQLTSSPGSAKTPRARSGRSTIAPAKASAARQRSSEFAELLEQAMSEAG